MATYPATSSTRYERPDRGSGAGVKVLALFLGIAVGVLVVLAVVLVRVADDARDEATAATPATPSHAHDASSVSLPLQSFAGVTGEDAEALAKAHAATDASLPAVPAADLVKVHMTLKDMVVEIAPGV
ncbi:MAG TPA: hypothetical protein VFT94_02080, partial [Gaiellaceae bacterium]|nr:hypothetical protein [Gaiellaceae bacterium]